MESIARAAAAQAGLEPDLAALAARLAKADLSTGLVDELSSLQGRIGAEYALRDGCPEAAALAIGAHYSVEACSALEGVPRRAAFLLLIVDMADKLAGYLGLGLAPKGSADPFALRQAATQLVAAGWRKPWPHIEIEEIFRESWSAYAGQGIALDAARGREAAEALLRARYEQLIEAAHDAKRAVLEISGLPELGRPNQIRRRVQTAALIRTEPELVRTLRRPVSIVASAEEKGWRPDESGQPDTALARGLAEAGRTAAAALAADPPPSPEAAHSALAGLAAPIHAFFEGSLVMAEDAVERSRNLNLLAGIRDLIASLFDPRLLVLEGEEKA
jgi:glycyl-tRNA synthetase beta chain